MAVTVQPVGAGVVVMRIRLANWPTFRASQKKCQVVPGLTKVSLFGQSRAIPYLEIIFTSLVALLLSLRSSCISFFGSTMTVNVCSKRP